MAGPEVRAHYVDDVGNEVNIPMPEWMFTFVGAAAATAADGPPASHSFAPRYRMLRNTDTGREKKIKCPVIGGTFWTEAMNTTHTAVDVGLSAPWANCVAAGRIGEKTRDR